MQIMRTVGHIACVCSKKQRVAAVQESALVDDNDGRVMGEAVFLDAVDLIDDGSQPWLAEIKINGTTTLKMKVDSEADVCCISVEDHRRLFAQGCAGTLRQPNQPLHGPDGKCLDVSGSFLASFEYKGRHVDVTMYVLANVTTPLLSRLAGTQLGIVARLVIVSDAQQMIIDQ